MTNTTFTAVHKAAAEGNLTGIHELLEQKPIMTEDNAGRTPLHYALVIPFICDEHLKKNKLAIASSLVQYDTKMLVHQDKSGESPFHLMAASDTFHPILQQAVPLNPAAALLPNNSGEYPIHVAIANHQSLVQNTLLNIPEVNKIIDSKGDSLLHHAVRNNNLKLVERLIEVCHLEPEVTNNNSQKPIDIAKELNHTNTLNYLAKLESSQTNNLGPKI
tara:strand:- start:841 stop:1494 length:654 start_codon:yes stop_codon:yes gene_type:complete